MSKESSAAYAKDVVHIRNKAELREAFDAWVEQHGYIWFEGDLTFAACLASYLGMSDLSIDGLAMIGGRDDDE